MMTKKMIFNMDNGIKLFIFDMDGLLVDTGRFSYKIYLEVAKEMDYEMTKEVYYAVTGQREKEIREKLKYIYEEKADIDLWRDRVNKIKAEKFSDFRYIPLKKGAKEILLFAKQNGIKTVLASSNSKTWIKTYLQAVDIYHLFDFIISGEMVERGKPYPDIFLKACEVAGITNKSSIVFEDSISGIEAAQNADIKVVKIADDLSDLKDYHGSVKIINNPNIDNELKSDYTFVDLLEAKKYFETIIN